LSILGEIFYYSNWEITGLYQETPDYVRELACRSDHGYLNFQIFWDMQSYNNFRAEFKIKFKIFQNLEEVFSLFCRGALVSSTWERVPLTFDHE
jgi:hypothetical protein